ncbi:hypothetical protein EV1_005455 [Malus domestica]|nr:hypothetical protein GBA52_015348 [Prunus armeniaca]
MTRVPSGDKGGGWGSGQLRYAISVPLEMNSLLSFPTTHGKAFLLGSSDQGIPIQRIRHLMVRPMMCRKE